VSWSSTSSLLHDAVASSSQLRCSFFLAFAGFSAINGYTEYEKYREREELWVVGIAHLGTVEMRGRDRIAHYDFVVGSQTYVGSGSASWNDDSCWSGDRLDRPSDVICIFYDPKDPTQSMVGSPAPLKERSKVFWAVMTPLFLVFTVLELACLIDSLRSQPRFSL
jgi:hypothetical protein